MTDFADKSFVQSSRPLEEVMGHELATFRLFQHVPYASYRRDRLAFLEGLKAETHASYLRGFRPVIAVFAGSFNPFHRGHLNVLEKAEKIFDKVIVAFGRNPEKDGREWPVPSSIRNRQLESYDGLLTDFIAGLGHD